MLADHLQGKLRRRKGRPSDPEILDRNRQAWEYHQELTRERRLSYEAAIAAMAEEYEEVDPEKEASNYEGMLRGWIDAYSRVRKGLDSP